MALPHGPILPGSIRHNDLLTVFHGVFMFSLGLRRQARGANEPQLHHSRDWALHPVRQAGRPLPWGQGMRGRDLVPRKMFGCLDALGSPYAQYYLQTKRDEWKEYHAFGLAVGN